MKKEDVIIEISAGRLLELIVIMEKKAAALGAYGKECDEKDHKDVVMALKELHRHRQYQDPADGLWKPVESNPDMLPTIRFMPGREYMADVEDNCSPAYRCTHASEELKRPIRNEDRKINELPNIPSHRVVQFTGANGFESCFLIPAVEIVNLGTFDKAFGNNECPVECVTLTLNGHKVYACCTKEVWLRKLIPETMSGWEGLV